ncbi:FAD-dependent oxidoreductase [Dactylosporangium sp. AC04546]|uniref:NAD(P)/FAD-dependent oxidoreductase n=1 Tax=Dactylosporangium sp. AC04546 TaxID=2862460 RepID=UPI001EDD1663|nr:FAD-dependent oxidoreductase [Dactylosporangium sp. AC04546]WVK87829.1 FAD-dependent oxidoreductase [Dactylosporangium sp. AC04546]
MTSSVVVVGAGIAGLACARVLIDRGVDVRVLERGAVPGGRLASPAADGRPVDLGAAYFTVSDPAFRAVVDGWQRRGLVRPWTGHFEVYGESPHAPEAPGPVRWCAPGGLGSLAADLAADLPVRYGVAVRDLAHSGRGLSALDLPAGLGDRVVLAMPAPQAAAVHPPARAVAEAQDWRPCLAVALRYPSRSWPDFAGAFVNDHPVLVTVCDDGDRRGDRAPVLVAHSTPAYAREDAVADVEAAVREVLHLPDPAAPVAVRCWPESRPARPSDAQFALVDGVLLAGDGFGRPRVEAAFLSGRAAADRLCDTGFSKSPRSGDGAR